MRRRSSVAMLLIAGTSLTSLTGCGHSNHMVKDDLTRALNASLSSARTFSFIDQDLAATTTVSGEIADDNRYKLLLSSSGQAQWELVADNDGVADLFPDPAAIATYAGGGSSPADDVLTTFNAVKSFIPSSYVTKAQQNFSATLARPAPIPASLALAALKAGKWVKDPTGAPAAVSPQGASADKLSVQSPFFEAQTELALASQIVQETPAYKIRVFRKDDVQPTFKQTDDPFPAPPAGVTRYDVAEPDLPKPGTGNASGLPSPPNDDTFRKLAIYVKDGKVASIRLDYDILDRLNDVTQLYRIPIKLNKSAGVQLEEQLGQVIVDLIQSSGGSSAPFRVHENTIVFSYPKVAPVIELPKTAVVAGLGLLPGQSPAATSTTIS